MSQNGKSKVELLPEGKQVKHQPVKGSWISCAIFCKVMFINYISIVPYYLFDDDIRNLLVALAYIKIFLDIYKFLVYTKERARSFECGLIFPRRSVVS